MIAFNIFDLFKKKKKNNEDKPRQNRVTQNASLQTQKTNRNSTPIAPINSDYVSKRILGVNNQTGQTIIAPVNKRTDDLSAKLRQQNEEKLKKQQQEAEERKIKELQQKVAEEKKKKNILSSKEIQEMSRNNLLKNQFYDRVDFNNTADARLNKKKTESKAEAMQRVLKENAEKTAKYNKTSKTNKELVKKQNKQMGNLEYLERKLGAAAFRGLTGLAQAAATENARGMKKGEKDKSLNNILRNYMSINPTYASVVAAQDALTNLLKGDGKSVKQKAINFALDLGDSTVRPYTAMSELEGMAMPKGSYKQVLKMNEEISKPSKKLDKKLEKESSKHNKAVNAAGELLDVVGYMAPSVAASVLTRNPNVGLVTMGVSSKGTSTMEALENNEDLERAAKIGTLKGEIEAATERLSGGTKVFGKGIFGDLGEKAITKTTNKINSKGLKTIAKLTNKTLHGTKNIVGEIGEETVSDILNTIVDKNTYKKDAKYTFEDWEHTAWLTAGATVILNTLTHGAFRKANAKSINVSQSDVDKAIKTAETQLNAEFSPEEKNIIQDVVAEKTNYTKVSENEQKVIDSITENRVKELKSKHDKVTKNDITKIEKEVRQDLERGYISTNDIERALSNEEWSEYDDLTKQREKLENQIKELESKTPQDYKTMGESNSSNEQLSRLKEQLNSIDANTTRNALNYAMKEKITNNDTLLQRAYGEEAEKRNAYQFDPNENLTKQTKKINEDIEKLELNNHVRNRDMIDFIKKISNDTGKQYRLVNNESEQMQNEYKKIVDRIAEKDNISKEEAQKKTENLLIDGFVSNGEIFINIDSENLINRITGHETTHLFEGTKEYKKLQEIAFDYAKTKGEYDSRRTSLEERYRGVDNANIENELTADLVGDYLFSDIDFIRNLSTEQPNIFKKIYNHVKHLYNMATAGSKEARQLEQLKYNFEKVYRENNQSKAGNNTKLMTSKVENNSKIEYNKDGIYIEDANEYGSLQDTVKYLQSQKLLKKRGTDFVENGKYWYGIKSKSFGDFKPFLKIEISGNETLIDNIKGEYKNGTYKNSKTVDSIIESIQNDRKSSNRDNVSITERESTKQDDRFYNREQEQNNKRRNNEQNGRINKELDSSFSNEKKYRGSHQIENAKAITELNINDIENRVKEIDGYLTKQSESDLRKLKKILNNPNEKVKIYRASPVNELNSGDWVTTDKEYAKNVADNNGGKVYEYEVTPSQLYYPDNVKDLPSLHRLSSFQYVIEQQNQVGTKYSLSVKEANTGTDNNGVKLTKVQQNYFKDSKATDEKGNLITVYHTTTDAVPQFNEFNPVGTQYYRFGDQVVNYYTNSKDMSGSYASQDYKMADTKKLNNVEDAKKYMEHISKLTGNVFDITQRGDNKFYATQDKQISKEARNFIEKLSETEKQQMLDNIYEDEKMKEFDSNYSRVFSWTEFDKDLLKKYNQLTDKYIGTADVVALQQEVMKYLESPVLLHEDARFNGEIIGVYDTEEEMLKNIKTDMQKSDWSKNSKIQYEGYVNITNPYVIDAEERNWNQVVQQSNEFIDELEERVPQDIKDNLTRLYQESANKSAEARENYDILEQVIRQGISGYNSSVDENVKKVNNVIRGVGFKEINQMLKGEPPGVNAWYNVADYLEREGLIGSATKNFIIDEFRLPNQVKELLQENYTKEIPIQQIQTNDIVKVMNQVGRKTTLKELYSKNMQNYNEFDKYRMPNSYFMEQISSEGNDYLGNELNDIFETRAEIYSPEQVGEEIAQASSVSFSKPEMIRLWGTSKTTNDVVKEIIASNKDGSTNYDGVIIKNVYDYGGKSATGTQANDLYITFNSNQFKAVDNKTPTKDADIRYKLSNKNDIAPVKKNDNEIFGREMKMQRDKTVQKAIAPLNKEIKTLKQEVSELKESASTSLKIFEEQNKQIAPLLEEQVMPPETENTPNIKDTSKMNTKDLKELSKNMKQQLGLTNRQKLDLENIIQEYSTSETATREDLYNEIKKRYGKQAIINEFEEIKKVQTLLKETKLDVSQNIKNDITDYNKLKQKNFGKIRFNREGQPVDVVYQELSGMYPDYFPKNIINDSDQFMKMVEIANMENKSIEEYDIDDDYLRETSDYIYDSIQESKQDVMKKAIEKERKYSFKSLLKEEKRLTPAIPMTENVVKDTINKQKIQEDIQGYRPYLEMAMEVNPEAKENQDIIDLLNKIDSDRESQTQIQPEEKQTSLTKAKSYLQYMITNDNEAIDKFAKRTGNKKIKHYGDKLNNLYGIISANISNHQTDNNGTVIGKGVNDIFNQARDNNLSEAFDDYLFHKSNIVRHRNGKGSAIPSTESEQLVKQYEKEYPEMKEWANDVNTYFKNLLQLQQEAGLITQDLVDSLNAMYDFYVPFIENIDGIYTPERTNQIKTRSTVKRARGGSERNILPFEDAMIQKTKNAFIQMNTNKLFAEIIKETEQANMAFENNSNPFANVDFLNDGSNYYITGYIDGKPTQVKVSKELYRGLAKNEKQLIKDIEENLWFITKPIQTANEIRRNVLTSWNPSFIARNFIKDLHDGMWNSKYLADFVKNYPKAIKQLATGKGGVELERFLNSYGNANLRGNYNMLDSGVSNINKAAKTKSSSNSKAKNMLNKVAQINQIVELAPRYAEYLSSIENGCSHDEAMYNAREVTVNFGRGGIATKAANRNGVTFLNASVQGLSKFGRNLSGDNGTRAMVGSIAKAISFGLAPALINALLLGDDDDYEVIPDYIKDNYILIKIDEDKADKLDKTGKVLKSKGSYYLRIPYGRAMSIFGSAGRRTLERLKGQRSELSLAEDLQSWGKNAWNQVGIADLGNNFLTAPISQAIKNEAWYGGDIVPKRLQTDKDGKKIPAEQQYDSSIDKFSIWLGKHTGWSPYKINYVIDQYSGFIGDVSLPAITEEAQSNTNSVVGRMIAPIKDQFEVNSITDNKNVSNFYSKYEDIGEELNRNNTKTNEVKYEYMKNISIEMGMLYKEMRKVQENKKLTRKQKYAKSMNIKAEINKLAEEGMKGYKNVETYDNYARVGERELHKYTNKDGETKWYAANEKYDAVVDELGLTTKEKNEYYTTQMNMSAVANKYNDNQGAERYHAVLNTIKKSNLPSDAKYQLYNNWYGKGDDKSSSIAQDVGISANDYIKFKTADLSSTKNKNGYSIRGSKASKVIDYLNKTNLDVGQKAILYRMSFAYKGNYSNSSYSNAYNETIARYIDKSNLTYEESIKVLKELGFKVYNDGRVTWD